MPPVEFEPMISAGERPQTHALDRAATGTGFSLCITSVISTALIILGGDFGDWVRMAEVKTFCSNQKNSPLSAFSPEDGNRSRFWNIFCSEHLAVKEAKKPRDATFKISFRLQSPADLQPRIEHKAEAESVQGLR